MNKNRILKLIQILLRKTDSEHRLSLNQIIALLEEDGVKINDRKTLYDDMKVLSRFGFDVEFDRGYYLSGFPFSLAEVKVMIDSLSTLKDLDHRFLDMLCEKIFSFISEYEEKDLKKLNYSIRHSNSRFIMRLEDVLYAIRNGLMMKIRRRQKDQETIAPLFLHRQNDHYYLYYHYPDDERVYHTRFDNISSTLLSEEKDTLTIDRQKIISLISESTRSFHSGKARIVRFQILNDSSQLRSRLQDSFPDLVYTKEGFYVRASVNKAFFAALCSFGDEIKIGDQDVADAYVSFLDDIITRNRTPSRCS